MGPRLLLTFLLIAIQPLAAAATDQEVRIGVLAFNGAQKALARWQHLANYLDRNIEGYRFKIVPLTHEGFRNSIRKGQLDFILTNPAHYVRLEVSFGATRIATFRNRHLDQPLTQFGSVIFTRDDSEIKSLADLRGKSLAAVNREAFGGFLLARKRLQEAKIDAMSDLKPVWLGFPQSDIVRAVLDGRADAGTVRTGILEQLVHEHKLDIRQLRILGAKSFPGFPFLLSTQLYPEWPFARLPHTDPELARQVTLQLLQLPPESQVARVTGGAGWTIPLDYSGVHEILKQFGLEPYLPREMTLGDLWDNYADIIAALVSAFLVVLLIITYILQINRKLQQSQAELTRHRDELENRVEERTQALLHANQELSQDIEYRKKYEETLQSGCECLQSIHALIVRDDLTRKQRLQSILDLIRGYFHADQVLLSRISSDQHTPVFCSASPAMPVETQALRPQLLQRAVDQQQFVDLRLEDKPGTPTRYIANPVVHAAEVICTIELTIPATDGETAQAKDYDELGMRILQIVTHWLAFESDAQARDAIQNQAAELLADLTPRENEVLREVTGGASNKLIARHLGISVKTVELHRSNLMHKLQINNAADLTRLAMRAGILKSDNISL